MSVANTIDDISSLSFFEPLYRLDHDKLTELAERSPLLSFRKGQPLAAGIDRNHIVYLLSGTLEYAPNSAHTEIIKADSERARHAILAPDKRSRVIAQSSVEVLCIDAELLDLLLNWDSGGGFEVDELDTEASAGWLGTLMQSDAVLSLSPSSIQALMAVVEPVEFKADCVIFEQGDQPDYYYIVSRGRCAITRRAAQQDAPVTLATVGPGEAFGEEALIANTPRGATVRMLEDGLLLRLDQHNFKRLLEQSLVHVVDQERAHSLKARGAQVLDLRNADDFAVDGSGMNIPFAELRGRMDDLDRTQKYLVLSDDNRMSAVAAFLLGKQRFKVYVLQTPAMEGFAVKAAAATAQAGELRARLAQVQQQLDTANTELAQQAEQQSAYRQRQQSLEAELNQVKAEAKKAIVQAGSLKTKAEAKLRERIDDLSTQLDQERDNGRHLVGELERLKERSASLAQQLQDSRQQAQQRSEDASLTNLRVHNLTRELGEEKTQRQALVAENDRLNGQLAQLTNQLQQIQGQLAKTEDLPQVGALQAELAQQCQRGDRLQNQNEDLNQRLQTLAAELQQMRQSHEQEIVELTQARRQEADLHDSVSALRTQLEQVQRDYEQASAARQALDEQLNSAARQAEQQDTALSQLEAELRQREARVVELADERDRLQRAVPALEASLEQSCQAQVELQQHVKDLARSRSDLEHKLAALNDQLQAQAGAVGERDALQRKLAAQMAVMAEKEAGFAQAESDFEQRLQALEAELGSTSLNALQEADKAAQEMKRLQLRIQVLSEELSTVQSEKQRSGVFLKLLLITTITLGGAYAAAIYSGIDVHTSVGQWLDQAGPWVKRLMHALPAVLQPESMT